MRHNPFFADAAAEERLRLQHSCAGPERAKSKLVSTQDAGMTEPTPTLNCFQMAAADAVETCCSVISRTSPANPLSRTCHSNGPTAARATARAGSSPLNRVRIVSMSRAECTGATLPADFVFVPASLLNFLPCLHRCGLRTRTVDAGCLTRPAAGRLGRATSSPPQFGQAPRNRSAAQAEQKVHSNEQMRASVESGERSRSQHSQFGRRSSIWAPPLLVCGRIGCQASFRWSARRVGLSCQEVPAQGPVIFLNPDRLPRGTPRSSPATATRTRHRVRRSLRGPGTSHRGRR